jgi:hypothetical protein
MVLAALVSAQAACLPLGPSRERAGEGTATAPHITSIEVADWPPLGPKGSVTATVSDDTSLSRVEASFKNHPTKHVGGTAQTVAFTGAELGEGFGTLRLTVHDSQGAWAKREVDKLLVDLTPPQVQIGKRTLRPGTAGPDGELELWVGDAWVLGKVELSFRGQQLRFELPHVYPATLGKAWDVSRVAFEASSLPVGSGTAVLVVTDAAGNSTTQSFTLTIDATPPSVSIPSPTPESSVTGAFEVRVSASDPGGGPVSIEVSVGGSEVATVAGPAATVWVQAEDFASGDLDVAAVAIDEAGNRSEPARVGVQVP